VLEEHMLTRGETVGGVGEDVCNLERGCGNAGVVDAGIAIGGDADSEVERARACEGEAEVGR